MPPTHVHAKSSDKPAIPATDIRRSFGRRPFSAVELLAQAQALQHDPNNPFNNGRTQKAKGIASRPHTPEWKAPPLTQTQTEPHPLLSQEQRRIDDLTIRTKTTFVTAATSSSSSAVMSTTRRFHPYPLKQDLQFTRAHFVLPEKVLTGPVSTTPRIRASNTGSASSYILSTGTAFQGKPVLIGHTNEGITAAPQKTQKTDTLPLATTTQAYTYAMSITGELTAMKPLQSATSSNGSDRRLCHHWSCDSPAKRLLCVSSGKALHGNSLLGCISCKDTLRQ